MYRIFVSPVAFCGRNKQIRFHQAQVHQFTVSQERGYRMTKVLVQSASISSFAYLWNISDSYSKAFLGPTGSIRPEKVCSTDTNLYKRDDLLLLYHLVSADHLLCRCQTFVASLLQSMHGCVPWQQWRWIYPFFRHRDRKVGLYILWLRHNK